MNLYVNEISDNFAGSPIGRHGVKNTKYSAIMRFFAKTRYESPCVRDARLEAEGILCGSIVTEPTVDELHNMSSEPETNYFEF